MNTGSYNNINVDINNNNNNNNNNNMSIHINNNNNYERQIISNRKIKSNEQKIFFTALDYKKVGNLQQAEYLLLNLFYLTDVPKGCVSFHLSEIYLELGLLEEAERHAKVAIEIQPMVVKYRDTLTKVVKKKMERLENEKDMKEIFEQVKKSIFIYFKNKIKNKIIFMTDKRITSREIW